jgi:monovalent cation/proton antiporter MnhG/PhaG subunit
MSRFTDVLNRLHAFGEISTIGMAGILIGGALIMPSTWIKMLGLAVFLIISAPTATHAVGVVVTHIGQTARHYKPTEAEQPQV